MPFITNLLSTSVMAKAACSACELVGSQLSGTLLHASRRLDALSVFGESMKVHETRSFASASQTPTSRAKRQTHEEVEHYLSNLFNLETKIALVTGGSGAVGRHLCSALARSGADVVVTDVPQNLEACKKVAETVQSLGRDAVALPADVRDQESINAAMAEVDRKWGKLDILVCNAGILGEMQLPQNTTEDNWRAVLGTNLDGTFHTCRAAHPLLQASGHGRVVIMSSIAGMYGYGPQSAYCASKGALIPLMKSLALAWAPDHINVNAVMPGAANTPFTMRVLYSKAKVDYMLERIPLKRLAEPEDFVGPIVFLSSHASDYMTGSTLVVDGGGTARAMAQ
eukprot:CAMPEP_0202900320 /NCGR_PEP_ID=MMETSP1392-20130828/11108_1 /ASSEMBLY_ACC=CAM_ASM_000868 /TAXON_ID=225041 /ORGANISM="Chlamydomonas chlamydogama, Strain SAG 11-48b" /LENGTH=339 /DNA_ID=CAMNT_0049586689 /DNA_START=129 /DNA_END=1148 /DNA_ORIENTATION=+